MTFAELDLTLVITGLLGVVTAIATSIITSRSTKRQILSEVHKNEADATESVAAAVNSLVKPMREEIDRLNEFKRRLELSNIKKDSQLAVQAEQIQDLYEYIHLLRKEIKRLGGEPPEMEGLFD